MRKTRRPRRPGFRNAPGFTLVELMVAAFLILVVFFSVAQVYMYGRRQMVYEEDRRRASEVLESRMEALRRDYTYDGLPALNNTSVSFTVDGRTYTIAQTVTGESPQANATTVKLVVSWVAKVNNTSATRTMQATTILGRGVSS